MLPKENEFQFSRKTRTGILVLLAILLMAIMVWRLLPVMIPPQEDPAAQELQLAWQTFKKEHVIEPQDNRLDGQYDNRQYAGDSNLVKSGIEIHPFPFDPNTASEEELVRVGFQARTAKTIIKYRNKGGRFHKKEDLQKLYTLSKKDYERIALYVRIPEVQHPYTRAYIPEKKHHLPKVAMIELNDADEAALMSLRGIGTVFSKRILNFRNALGGFARVEQLKEVYGLPDSTYQQLQGYVTVDAGKIRKINVNTASLQELGRHPYIKRNLAINIIKLRNNLKNYSEIGQLRQVPLLNEENYRKIAPYLSTH